MSDQSESGLAESDLSVETQPPGALLKSAREKLGLQQSDVAERLRLSVQKIIDIENEDYTRFSAAVYLRGHLRAFARVVNLDELDVLQCYASMGFVFESDNQQHIGQEKLNKQEKTDSQKKVNRKPVGILMRFPRVKRKTATWGSISLFVLMILMVVLWWQEQGTHSIGVVAAVSEPVSPEIHPAVLPATKTLTQLEKSAPFDMEALFSKRTEQSKASNQLKEMGPEQVGPEQVGIAQTEESTHPLKQAKQIEKKKPHRVSSAKLSAKSFLPDYKLVPVRVRR